MKLFRYLAKEVLVSTTAVTLILLLVILSGRIVNYLGRATEGKMTFEFLFLILGLHIPSFIQMILPLAFFLSLLLAYGRLYIENEMSILFASGISKLKLARYTLGISLFVTLLSAFINFWLSPTAEYKVEEAYKEQDTLTVFDFIQPGRFQGSGQQTTYIDGLSSEGWMRDIFVSDYTIRGDQRIPTHTLATYGEQVRIESRQGANYLVLKQGTRYQGTPGSREYQVMQFDTYAIRLEEQPTATINAAFAMPTLFLLQSDVPKYQAELHWRIALVVMIPILAIIGLSLSQVNPRQGRFFKMLPAILLMIGYLGLLIWGKTAIEKQQIPIKYGLWWAHALFAVIAAYLFLGFNQVFRRRAAKLPKNQGVNGATK